MMKRAFLLGSLAILLGLGVTSASADTIFTLTQDGCSNNGCGAGPFGTITLSQSGSNVNVNLTLNSANSERFAGTNAGNSLEFNVLNATTADITNISSGFHLGAAPASASTFGSFLFSIDCNDANPATNPGSCHGGQAGDETGPLTFTVLNATISDFVANANGYYFASDIAIFSGDATVTGNVGALGPGTVTQTGVTPEPSSLMLFGTGLTAVGAMVRRKMTA